MINIGYLVSYDAPLLFQSLAHVYAHADAITVALDADRLTYGGEPFTLPANFFDELRQLDHRRIINVYEDRFYVRGLSAMAMEVRERNLLARQMGRGWCVQLDVDEYVYDFGTVAHYLRAHAAMTVLPSLTPIALRAEWVTLFKQVAGGILYVDAAEPMTLATSLPHFEYGRGSRRTWKHQTGIRIVHQSWARGVEEIQQKCRNWSHREEGQQFFELWQAATRENYRSFRRFHPLRADAWPRLRFLECAGVEDFVRAYAASYPQQPSPVTWTVAADCVGRGLRGLLGQSKVGPPAASAPDPGEERG